MARVDLHVHSRFSEHPSEWFLQRIGTQESYTDPEHVYNEAIIRGMTFVTLTDHNCIDGALLLKDKYPDRVFTGVEATTYFPEDGCKVHVLIYGLNATQFSEIERIRPSIYNLRDYIKEQNLAYSIAHATYSINGKLSNAHLEKCILLFDVFEGINGSRDQFSNENWMAILQNITPEHIERLYDKHKIEPFSTTPWEKAFTGGSDDHAAFFIGRTYTSSNAITPQEFVESLKRKTSNAGGRHNDYKSLAFTVYKIAYDFSKTKRAQKGSLIGAITDTILDNEPNDFRTRLNLQKLRLRRKQNKLSQMLFKLTDGFKKDKTMPIEEKLNIVYDKLASMSDEFLLMLFQSLQNSITNGDVIGSVKNVSSSLPGIFVSIPFFSSLRHMNLNRQMLLDMAVQFGTKARKEKKVVWFTDTLNDLNGISGTIKRLGWMASKKNKNLTIVTSLPAEEQNEDLPPNVLYLEPITTYTPSFYDTITLRIPSVLKSLENIYEEKPDEILISTPGPVGLLGLLAARLLNIKSVGVYHTDFTRQADEVIGDELMSKVVEIFTKWFYTSLDEIRVPTSEYITILRDRNFDADKMTIFRRGIEGALFCPDMVDKASVLKKWGINDGITLLYTGRIGKEKSLDFLADIYLKLIEKRPEINLMLVGDGPHRQELQERLKDYNRVLFTGRLNREQLPELYSAADIFVFPSVTDTFGMSVLEAQSCGLPAIVSDVGGPKEIVLNDRTGYIAKANDHKEWKEKITRMISVIETMPDVYLEMRHNIRQHIIHTYDWDMVLEDIVSDNTPANKTINDTSPILPTLPETVTA